MALMIILGGIAVLYMIWLMFRLATFALPVYAGISAGLYVHGQGHGVLAMIVTAFVTGLAILLVGQLVVAWVRSPILSFLVALLFAVPADFAGYQVMTALLGLMAEDSAWVTALAVVAGLITASSAWRNLGSAAPLTGDEHLSRPEAAPSPPAPQG